MQLQVSGPGLDTAPTHALDMPFVVVVHVDPMKTALSTRVDGERLPDSAVAVPRWQRAVFICT